MGAAQLAGLDTAPARRAPADAWMCTAIAHPVLRLLRLAELRVLAAQKWLGRIETAEGKIYFYKQRERSPLLIKGHLPALKGKDAEQRLTCVFHALQAL